MSDNLTSLRDLCFHCHHWTDDHYFSHAVTPGAFPVDSFKCKNCDCIVVVNQSKRGL